MVFPSTVPVMTRMSMVSRVAWQWGQSMSGGSARSCGLLLAARRAFGLRALPVDSVPALDHLGGQLVHGGDVLARGGAQLLELGVAHDFPSVRICRPSMMSRLTVSRL